MKGGRFDGPPAGLHRVQLRDEQSVGLLVSVQRDLFASALGSLIPHRRGREPGRGGRGHARTKDDPAAQRSPRQAFEARSGSVNRRWSLVGAGSAQDSRVDAVGGRLAYGGADGGRDRVGVRVAGGGGDRGGPNGSVSAVRRSPDRSLGRIPGPRISRHRRRYRRRRSVRMTATPAPMTRTVPTYRPPSPHEPPASQGLFLNSVWPSTR